MVAERKPQVIISDYLMAPMNGLEFIRKAYEIDPSSLRIIQSGYAVEEAIQQALDSKILDKFVNKPWEPKSVREDIQAWIAEYWVRKSASAA